MSSATQPTPAANDRTQKVIIISHTPFFYWWPLWVVGFVMAALTYWYGDPVVIVPAGTEVKRGAQVDGVGKRDILIVPEGKELPNDYDGARQPRLRMAASNSPGVIWTLTLCFCVIITHVPLRGVYSVIVLVVLVFAVVLLAVFDLWDSIFRAFEVIDIHITAASYLTISLFLFVIWLLTFLLYDRLIYMIFTRGQLRVRKAVGLGETVIDTRGMVVQRHRDALFRHWLLGFGSGDLTVHTAGANARQFEMPNVLNIDRKLTLIHTMLQEREVVKSR
jgi:hypothetical protein